jgi:hypothetical protein
MKFALRAALLASVVLAAVPALAQTAQQDGARGGAVSGVVGGAVVGAVIGGPIGAVIGGVIGGTSGAAVGTLTADDGVYVQRYVYERKVQPVVMQEALVIGQPLPPTVATYQFEGNPRLSNYRYAYVNQQYLMVDSNGRVMGSIVR